MATTTPNHGFTKPAATDNVSIAVLNSNMDKLDGLFDAKEITMLNYALAAANNAISTSDTVNTAIGKLEKGLQPWRQPRATSKHFPLQTLRRITP